MKDLKCTHYILADWQTAYFYADACTYEDGLLQMTCFLPDVRLYDSGASSRLLDFCALINRLAHQQVTCLSTCTLPFAIQVYLIVSTYNEGFIQVIYAVESIMRYVSRNVTYYSYIGA